MKNKVISILSIFILIIMIFSTSYAVTEFTESDLEFIGNHLEKYRNGEISTSKEDRWSTTIVVADQNDDVYDYPNSIKIMRFVIPIAFIVAPLIGGILMICKGAKYKKKLDEEETINGVVESYKGFYKYFYHPIIRIVEQGREVRIKGRLVHIPKTIKTENQVRVLKLDNGNYIIDANVKFYKSMGILLIVIAIGSSLIWYL